MSNIEERKEKEYSEFSHLMLVKCASVIDDPLARFGLHYCVPNILLPTCPKTRHQLVRVGLSELKCGGALSLLSNPVWFGEGL